MKKILIILGLIIGVGITNTTQASHTVGGDLKVIQTGPNTFLLKYRLFRYCSGVDLPQKIGLGTGNSSLARVYDNVTNTLVLTYQTGNVDSIVTIPFGDDCYTPQGLCVKEYYYSATITLPNNPNGYYFTFSECCRNVIDNISGGGIILYAQIPDPALWNTTTGKGNSSPEFVRYPRDGYFCINNLKCIDFSCTDDDGDSLVYSLEVPLNGPGGSFAGPRTSFTNCTYRTTYGPANILGPGSSCTIDSRTGCVWARPAQSGLYVISVKVEEYRAGIKIGEVIRDIQYKALNCKYNTLPSFEPRIITETLKFDEDGCFDIVARDQDAEDTFLIQITSNAFAYGAIATLPTANSTGRYDFAWITPSGVLDTANNLNVKQLTPTKFEGVGSLGIRFCWNVDNCEVLAIDTFKINVYGFSVGCDASIDSVEAEYNIVIDKPTYSHNVPNVFSPNGDGKNDIFKLKKDQFDRCFDALTIRIYNRWGQNIYESDDAKFEWDGRDDKGNELTEGTYYVVLQGYYGGKEVTSNFPITLFR